jgi:Na+/H+-dicarboxylate symporter
MLGNGVATVIVARWEHEIDPAALREALSRPNAEIHAQRAAASV